jgi:hypothetical protein
MDPISRRTFLSVAGSALPCLAAPAANTFRFAVIADSHIIDPFYKGPEGNAEDTESIFQTAARLTSARDLLNALQPAPEKVFLVGDYFHNYPSTDIDFYFQNETRLDLAKKITDKFHMPVHVGFGNHDYDVPRFSRDASHELFRRKFNVKPYYSVEHKGWKFVHLNNFLGATWTPGDAAFNKQMGSLGEEQLNWFEAELREHKPTFVFVHFPLTIVAPKERAEYGLHSLVKRYRENIQLVVSGHWHRWFEFGRSFGPQHLVMAATRYDPNAYLIIDVDTKAMSHQLLNLNLVDWNTHFSKPYVR